MIMAWLRLKVKKFFVASVWMLCVSPPLVIDVPCGVFRVAQANLAAIVPAPQTATQPLAYFQAMAGSLVHLKKT